MTLDIERNLSSSLDQRIVRDLLASYRSMALANRKGEPGECLRHAGKFVENALRAVEFVRSRNAPKEIRSVSEAVKGFVADGSLSDSLRIMIPRVAQGMYEVRSKRAAVHVKEIDPTFIDAAFCCQCAGWILAELLRTYHSDDARDVGEAMAVLVRSDLPYIESFGNEIAVTTKVPVEVELLLIAAKFAPHGIDRRAIGHSSKSPAPRVTENLQKLEADRCLHKTKDGKFHITGPGDRKLSDFLAKNKRP